jgi:hypothetical protein
MKLRRAGHRRLPSDILKQDFLEKEHDARRSRYGQYTTGGRDEREG